MGNAQRTPLYDLQKKYKRPLNARKVSNFSNSYELKIKINCVKGVENLGPIDSIQRAVLKTVKPDMLI